MKKRTNDCLYTRVLACFMAAFLFLGAVPLHGFAAEPDSMENVPMEEQEDLHSEPSGASGSSVRLRWEIPEPDTVKIRTEPEKELYDPGEEISFTLSLQEGFDLKQIGAMLGENEIVLREAEGEEITYILQIPETGLEGEQELVITVCTAQLFSGYPLEGQGKACTVEFSEERILPGQTISAKLLADAGHTVPPDRITVLIRKEDENLQEAEFRLTERSEDGRECLLEITGPDLGADETIRILVDAEAVPRYEIRCVTAESDDASSDILTSVNISEKILYEGAVVTVSGIPAQYSRILALPFGKDSPVIPLTETENGYTFVMPGYDVELLCEEILPPLVMDPEDVYTPDTDFQYGEKSEIPHEPSMEVKKSVSWTNIQAGEALLTIGEYDLNQYSNVPCDYIIMVDCSATMDTRDGGSSRTRYELANEAIRELLSRIEQDNQTLSPSMQSRVAFMTYSGSGDNGRHPTSAQYESSYYAASDNIYSSGEHDYFRSGVYEYGGFTTELDQIRSLLNLKIRRGSKINLALDKAMELLQEKRNSKRRTKVINVSDCGNGWYGQMREGYFSGKLITDWMGVRNADGVTAEDKIHAMKTIYGAQFMQICIGPTEDRRDILRTSVSEATGDHLFWTYDGTPGRFDQIFTQIHDIPFEVSAVKKQVIDLIDTEYWEILGVVSCSTGMDTVTLTGNRLVWNLPDGTAEKKQTCKLALKLKDIYRYEEGADAVYRTNADGSRPGLTYSYTISGGIYEGEKRTGEVKTPALKYGTVELKGRKVWTVKGSSASYVDISLRQTLPGFPEAVIEQRRLKAPDWSFSCTNAERRKAGRYPYIKYNNTGQRVSYRVTESVPAGYTEKPVGIAGSSEISVHLYNEPYKIKARVKKVDEETGNPLSGAVFQVYQWDMNEGSYIPYRGKSCGTVGGTGYEAGDMTANGAIVELKETSRGIYETESWLYYTPENGGRFAVVEATAPYGYFGDWKRDDLVTEFSSDADKLFHELTISLDGSNRDQTLSVADRTDGAYGNTRVLGQVSVQKTDREAEAFHAQGDASLAGAAYKLYALDDIVHADGSKKILYRAGEEVLLRQAAKGSEMNIYVYADKGETEGTSIVIPEGGRVLLKELEQGAYYLEEISAGEGYLIHADRCEFRVSYGGEKQKIVKLMLDGGMPEQVKKQKLRFYKMTGMDTQDQILPLEGAGFSVYLVSGLENGKYASCTDEQLVQLIIDQYRDPKTLLYEKIKGFPTAPVFDEPDSEDVRAGRLVKELRYRTGELHRTEQKNGYLTAELKSDRNGIVTLPFMPYGRYLVVETTTPPGKTATRPFVFSVEADEYHGSTDGKEDNGGKPLDDRILLMDRPVSSFVRILKMDSKSFKTVLKPGASYVIHDVDGAWFDYAMQEKTSAEKRAYREKYGDLVVQYSQGTYAGSPESPYQTRLIPSASSVEKAVYIDTVDPLPAGNYELEEVRAPQGYVLQGKEGVIRKNGWRKYNGTFFESREEGRWKETPENRTRFCLSSEYAVYDPAVGGFVTEVRQANDPVIGKISIYAEGEYLRKAVRDESVTVTGLGEYRNFRFIYEKAPSSGAEFRIYAAEDIYSQEYDEDARERMKLSGHPVEPLFRAGDEVTVLTTDEAGQAWTGNEDWPGTEIAKGLPLGRYQVVQTKAGDGLVLTEENRKPREIRIEYEGQEVPVIYRDEAYENSRQKIELEVEKRDQDTKKPLSGAVFGLYAKEDLRKADGKTVIKAGTLIAVAETIRNSEGRVENAVFSADLPSAEYEIRELLAPEGYIRNPSAEPADASFQEGIEKLSLKKTFDNQSTCVEIRKLDRQTGQGLAGAVIGVYRENGELAARSTTAENGRAVFRGLSEGVYTFRELSAPSGYALNMEEGSFRMDRNGTAEGTLMLLDDPVRIRIRKVDENGKPLPGAEFTLYEDGGKALEKKVSDEQGNLEFYGLPEGSYVIRETLSPAGYRLSEECIQLEITPQYVNEEVYEVRNIRKAGKKHSSDSEDSPETLSPEMEISVARTEDGARPFVMAGLTLAALAGILFTAGKMKRH